MTRPLATTSAETAARYHVAKHNGPRSIAPPDYATDGIAIPRRKRRVLLDLAPVTVRLLLESVRLAHAPIHGFVRDDVARTERMLVAALDKAR